MSNPRNSSLSLREPGASLSRQSTPLILITTISILIMNAIITITTTTIINIGTLLYMILYY